MGAAFEIPSTALCYPAQDSPIKCSASVDGKNRARAAEQTLQRAIDCNACNPEIYSGLGVLLQSRFERFYKD